MRLTPSPRRIGNVSTSWRSGARSAYQPAIDRPWASLRRHHLLRAPLTEQSAERRRLHRLVEHRDVFIPRGQLDGGAAVGGDQDRRDGVAEAAADVADGGNAVAAVEMIVDQQAGDAAAGGFDRGDCA